MKVFILFTLLPIFWSDGLQTHAVLCEFPYLSTEYKGQRFVSDGPGVTSVYHAQHCIDLCVRSNDCQAVNLLKADTQSKRRCDLIRSDNLTLVTEKDATAYFLNRTALTGSLLSTHCQDCNRDSLQAISTAACSSGKHQCRPGFNNNQNGDCQPIMCHHGKLPSVANSDINLPNHFPNCTSWFIHKNPHHCFLILEFGEVVQLSFNMREIKIPGGNYYECEKAGNSISLYTDLAMPPIKKLCGDLSSVPVIKVKSLTFYIEFKIAPLSFWCPNGNIKYYRIYIQQGS